MGEARGIICVQVSSGATRNPDEVMTVAGRAHVTRT